MEFRFTEEQERFRRDVREFLLGLLPPGYDPVEQDELDEAGYALAKHVQKALAARGWLCPGWPVEYGGAGMSVVEQAILNEEMAYWRVPRVYGMGPGLVGPTLIKFGSDEQKARHLPRIAAGDWVYWQAFSEPHAGSDLAALRTRAVQDGDDFVVNGQKVYIGDEHEVDYLYTLVRTDPDAPRHRGITAFLIDARSPGITYLPLKPLAGARKNQIFFENVRVPARDMVGPVNGGWTVAMTSLGLERSGIGNVAELRRTFDELVTYCRETRRAGRALADDPTVRARLAELKIELERMRLFSWRTLWRQANDLPLTYEPSQGSLQAKVFGPRFAAVAAEIVGPPALIKRGSRWSALAGRLEHLQRYSLLTHGGGTPEIQKNIIAQRGLGLPRGR
ncbi:MAG: acyl-CoA dehydrogenase [Dehalococcoidia bacterium]|nr:MAG: acyl-CoA dehydrogenase [Dehalococcoidia bacterium]